MNWRDGFLALSKSLGDLARDYEVLDQYFDGATTRCEQLEKELKETEDERDRYVEEFDKVSLELKAFQGKLTFAHAAAASDKEAAARVRDELDELRRK